MFDDRIQAGRVLGRLIAKSVTDSPLIVLALPRGGVPVAFEAAKILNASIFDIFLVRKLGVPGQEELAFGAIASGGIRVLNHALITQLQISRDTIDEIAQQEQAELDRQERAYRDGRRPPELRDGSVVMIDDGIATGATMIAALQAIRLQRPRKVIVAAPVASREAQKELSAVAGQVICVEVPHRFAAVGSWYRDFSQVNDGEVRDCLARFTTFSNTPHTALQTPGSAGSK